MLLHNMSDTNPVYALCVISSHFTNVVFEFVNTFSKP